MSAGMKQRCSRNQQVLVDHSASRRWAIRFLRSPQKAFGNHNYPVAGSWRRVDLARMSAHRTASSFADLTCKTVSVRPGSRSIQGFQQQQNNHCQYQGNAFPEQ